MTIAPCQCESCGRELPIGSSAVAYLEDGQRVVTECDDCAEQAPAEDIAAAGLVAVPVLISCPNGWASVGG